MFAEFVVTLQKAGKTASTHLKELSEQYAYLSAFKRADTYTG